MPVKNLAHQSVPAPTSDRQVVNKISLNLEVFTNLTRPSATLYAPGAMIYNSDDLAVNISDGSLWRNALGILT